MSRPAAATPVYDVMGVTVEFLTPQPPSALPFCIMRGIIPAGAVVPMHSHPDPESFFVVSGEAQVLVERDGRLHWQDVKSGDFVHVPPAARHAHRNPSPAPVTELVITTPDLGEFFVEIGRPVPVSGVLPVPTQEDLQRLVAAAARHRHWLATPEENAAVGITMS